MAPARSSASMAICLPGMASSVKRAATSATRSAPLAMTMNWMIVRIRNTTAPTTKLPRTTNLPKEWMTSPASACSRMRRVDETLSASRNSVVISSSVGKVDELERVAARRATTSSSATATAMLTASSRSSSRVGSGTIIIATIATTNAASARSAYLTRAARTSPPPRGPAFTFRCPATRPE